MPQDSKDLPPSNRKALRAMLVQVAELRKRGVEVDTGRVQQIQKLYYEQVLERLCKGEGTDLDVQDLVVWHWPKLLETQPRLPIDRWQCRIIRAILAGRLTDMKEVYVKGCTKAGKGFAVAVAACLWYQSRKDSCRIIVTSNSADHAKKVMMAEIIRMRKAMRFACRGRNSREQVWTSETKCGRRSFPYSTATK